MNDAERPLPLKNAPLMYAPENELGVVFLFSRIAPKLGLRIEKIRAGYPDCIAWKHDGDRERRVLIEFEYRSSNFRVHGHDASKCDCIVCWHDDWPGARDQGLKVIELKRNFGMQFKVWIQVAIKSQHGYLEKRSRMHWALSPRATQGDLLLMYRGFPTCSITDIFRLSDRRLKPGFAGWIDEDREVSGGMISRVCKLDDPISLEEFRRHQRLKTSSFVRSNMQGRGGLLVSPYWHDLYTLIYDRNPKARKALAKFAPEKLYL